MQSASRLAALSNQPVTAAPAAAELRFEFARAIIEHHPAARAVPRFTASFNLDQLVRERTAGKGYTPADGEQSAP